MLVASLTACAEKDAVNKEDTANHTQQTQEQNAQNGTETQDDTADKYYATRIKVSINPDADILIGQDGKVVEIVCNNDDAVVAYGNLEVAGKDIEDVTKEMVNAATDSGYMQDTKPVTLTLMD